MEIISAEAFFFISDLHMGGEGDVEEFTCEAELIRFLKRICDVDGATLVLLGDVFDFWQMRGTAKKNIGRILEKFHSVFEQFRHFSASHNIYYLPGNHDRDSRYSDSVIASLEEYGIQTLRVDTVEARLTQNGRDILTIIAEHGHQVDASNRYQYPPNPAEHPFGEYLMRMFINPIKQMNKRRDQPWLREIDNVHPLQMVPWWMTSKYFYREAGFWIKILSVPSALLFGLTKLTLLLVILRMFGVDLVQYGLPHIPRPILYGMLSFLGIDLAMMFVLGFMWLLRKDMIKSLKRWGIDDLKKIISAWSRRFRRHAARTLRGTEARLYIYGHTHNPHLDRLRANCYWANTGTWMMRMEKISTWSHMPPVFAHSHSPTYIFVGPDRQGAVVALRSIRKDFKQDLTFLERIATFRRGIPTPQMEEDKIIKQIVIEKCRMDLDPAE